MSESVFGGLCLIVGTSQQVAIRRDVTDFEEILTRKIKTNYELDDLNSMVCGSIGEGFRLEGSDIDIMYWPSDIRVVMDMFQSEYYDTPDAKLLSDSSESPPGFTLLQVVTPPEELETHSLLVKINDSFYMPCSRIREYLCSKDTFVHGPCASTFVEGTALDLAVGFACDIWPPLASSWKDRCHSWPDPQVVNDIIRGGCHFVAIGHPLGQYEDIEWRTSFSQAERKCVYAMNHCQFLTYGLLKLFLKEVINQQLQETNELLCSYHIKTAILWVVQQNTLPKWCPQNLLVGFWTCFKLLIKWVYEGICPNFFIPQNNLFLSKIYGSAQNKLFQQLHELYKKGIACLLQCSSIRSCLMNVFENPRLSICTDESGMKLEGELDEELFYESDICSGIVEGMLENAKDLYTFEQLIGSHLTQYQVVLLQKRTVSCLIYTVAATIQRVFNNSCFNKQVYTVDKMCCQLLKLAAKFGCVSDMLYVVMFYYKTYRYRKALSFLELTKTKLARPYLMYNGHVDNEMYIEAVGGKSWSTKMRQAVARDIELNKAVIYINELVPVQQFARQNGDSDLEIPVFVMLHFLEFLCYRHIDTALSQTALDELQVLVQYGRTPYVPATCKEISLQILGLCQQMTENP